VAYIVRRGLDEGAAKIEVSTEAEQAWIDQCIQTARQTGDFFENCTPGYYNNEGKPGERSAQDGFYGGGSPEFIRILDAWRAEGKLAGLVVE
jgi:cyclohexanone monooxygenase